MMHLLLLSLAMGLAQNTEALLFSINNRVNFGIPVLEDTLTKSDLRKSFGVDSNVATAIIAQFDIDGDGILAKSELSTCLAMSFFARLKNDRDSGTKINLRRLNLYLGDFLRGNFGRSTVFSDVDFKTLIADGKLTNSDLKTYFDVTMDVATAIIAEFDNNGDGVLVTSEFTTARCMAAFARLKNDRDSGIKINLERLKSVFGNRGGSTVFSDDDFKTLIADGILTNSDLKMYFGVTMDVASVIIAQFDGNVDGVLVRSEFTTARCMTAFERLKNDKDSGKKIDLARLLDLNINHVFSDDGFKNRIADGKLTDSDLKIYIGVTLDVASVFITEFDSNGDGVLVRSEFTTARCMAALARLKYGRDYGIKIDLARIKLLLDLNINGVFSDDDFKTPFADDQLTNSDLETYFGVTLDVATVIIAQFDRNGDGVLVRSEFTTARCTTAFARLKNDKDSGIKIDLARLLDLNINHVFSDDDFSIRIADGILTNSDLKEYFGVTLDVAIVIIAQFDSNVDGVLVRSEFTTARCMTAFARLKNDRDSGIKINLARLLDLNINHVFSDDDFMTLIADGKLTNSDLKTYFEVTLEVATTIIAQFDSNGDGVLVRSEFTTARCLATLARLKCDRISGIKIDFARIKLLLDLNGDQVDQCTNVRCLNNGKCERGICKCTPGYSGDDCGMNLCEIESCPSDTPCVPIIIPDGYVCSCVERLSINQLTGQPKCDARIIITPIQVYGKSQNVRATIPGVPGKKMVISFIDDFGIEQTDSCRSDYLQIAGVKYCGSKAPADITLSTGIGTQVRFVTNRVNEDVGYTFTYKYIDDKPDNNPCKNGGTRTPSETCTCRNGFEGPTCEGTPIITSPGINKEQETTFNLLGSPGKNLVLGFTDYFRTRFGRNGDDLDCEKDNVEIGNNRYCGGMAPSPITIPAGSGATVVFKCSGEVAYRTRLVYFYKET